MEKVGAEGRMSLSDDLLRLLDLIPGWFDPVPSGPEQLRAWWKQRLHLRRREGRQ